MSDPIFLGTMETDLLGLVGLAVSPRGVLRLRLNMTSKEEFQQVNQAIGDGMFVFSSKEIRPYNDQIQEYLAGDRQTFTLPIDWIGYTAFQRSVMEQTLRIPFGETRSYGQIAAAVNKPAAARAVGQAEKRNQVPLVIPCHRVIGSDGSLTGYGGSENTDLKARILEFEQRNLAE
jgi:methylated-DNA-[protein]-cysteine S-methyltransferase